MKQNNWTTSCTQNEAESARETLIWLESVTEKETGNAQPGACEDVLPRCCLTSGYTFFSSIENFSASQPSLAWLYSAAASPFERLRSDGSLVEKAALVIFYLALYSAPNKKVTYIVDFSGFKSKNSQLWSFFNLYSIRHAAEMWLIVHFLGFETENRQVWSISFLYSIQHAHELRQIFYHS